ncbi:hypothetical protein QNZ47_004570 [Enterobacter cloacae]|nr:hypothetical protein [Enterobacter cloacae]
MNVMLTGPGAPDRALLLCGMVVLLTAVVHIFVTASPLRATGRCIFLRPRPGVSRLLRGEVSPGVSLLWGLLATALGAVAGVLLRLYGAGPALPAGPVPGLLFTAWVVVASLRHLAGHGVVKVLLSGLSSLCLLVAGLLLLLMCEGAGWHLPLY